MERLAHHALRGEVWDKAVTYWQQAGTRANDRAAFREAVTAFEQALQALGHLPETRDTRVLAIDIRLALGDALTQLGEHGRRLTLLGKAETLARELDDQVRLGRVLASMALARRITGDPDGAMAASRQALDLAVALGFCQLVEANIVTRQIGTLPRSSLSLRQPTPCPSPRPTSQIGSSLLGDTPTPTANDVSVGSVGQ